jgi:predicted transcriptional regulator
MPKRKPYARIAITLPDADLAAADRLARAQDRSRSWIVAEAIRRYAAAMDLTGSTAAAPERTLATASLQQHGLGAQRLAQLKRDLSLTPEARVRAAEETLRLSAPRKQPRANRIVTFDRFEDFLDRKRTLDVP